MGARVVDPSLHMLVRHQWVRDHGTPRVTTLAGAPGAAVALWHQWLALTGRTQAQGRLFAPPAHASEQWMTDVAAAATSVATTSPRDAVAIAVDRPLLARWLRRHDHRESAFIAEGVVPVASRRRPAGKPLSLDHGQARSLAELALFEALEGTPATAGRFQLNQSVSFHFGSRTAEIDLLSRADELAIEVDGYHHFTDADGYRRDRRKDLLLQGHGYTVLRFLAEDVLADPRGAVQEVVELLGHRKAHDHLHRRR